MSFQGATSRARHLAEGLPQGSALSCSLFALYINDVAVKLAEIPRLQFSLYVDDIGIWAAADQQQDLKAILSRGVEAVRKYVEESRMILSAGKTAVCQFLNQGGKPPPSLGIKCGEVELTEFKQVRFLGIDLDQRLSLDGHCQTVAKKAMKRFMVVKRLGSQSWGGRCRQLRSLYLSYVRGLYEGQFAVLAFAAPTVLQRLVPSQNAGVRWLCGALPGSSSEAMHVLANIEPLEIRIERAVLECGERFLRPDTNSPERKMMESWNPPQCKREHTFMHAYVKLAGLANMPNSREPLMTAADWDPRGLAGRHRNIPRGQVYARIPGRLRRWRHI